MKLINAYYEFINLPYNSYPRNIVAISFTRATGISSARYIFFFSPLLLRFRRSLLVLRCRQDRLGRGSSPRDWDQRKNYQGSERGPGFGPAGDLPHVNKDRASVARSYPA